MANSSPRGHILPVIYRAEAGDSFADILTRRVQGEAAGKGWTHQSVEALISDIVSAFRRAGPVAAGETVEISGTQTGDGNRKGLCVRVMNGGQARHTVFVP